MTTRMVLGGLLAAVLAAVVVGAGTAGADLPGYYLTFSYTQPSNQTPWWRFQGRLYGGGEGAYIWVGKYSSPGCTDASGPEWIGFGYTDAGGNYAIQAPKTSLVGVNYIQATGLVWDQVHEGWAQAAVSGCWEVRWLDPGPYPRYPTYMSLNWGTDAFYLSDFVHDWRFYGAFYYDSPVDGVYVDGNSPWSPVVVGGYSTPDCSGPSRWAVSGGLDGSEHYAIKPPPTLFSAGPVEYVKAYGYGMVAEYEHGLVATTECMAITQAPLAQVNHEFLCYSKWQVQPSVWPWNEAQTLIKQGYWLPTALDGNLAGGTNLGSYNLQCNVTPKGDGYVGGSGEWWTGDWSSYAALSGGLYPH